MIFSPLNKGPLLKFPFRILYLIGILMVLNIIDGRVWATDCLLDRPVGRMPVCCFKVCVPPVSPYTGPFSTDNPELGADTSTPSEMSPMASPVAPSSIVSPSSATAGSGRKVGGPPKSLRRIGVTALPLDLSIPLLAISHDPSNLSSSLSGGDSQGSIIEGSTPDLSPLPSSGDQSDTLAISIPPGEITEGLEALAKALQHIMPPSKGLCWQKILAGTLPQILIYSATLAQANLLVVSTLDQMLSEKAAEAIFSYNPTYRTFVNIINYSYILNVWIALNTALKLNQMGLDIRSWWVERQTKIADQTYAYRRRALQAVALGISAVSATIPVYILKGAFEVPDTPLNNFLMIAQLTALGVVNFYSTYGTIGPFMEKIHNFITHRREPPEVREKREKVNDSLEKMSQWIFHAPDNDVDVFCSTLASCGNGIESTKLFLQKGSTCSPTRLSRPQVWIPRVVTVGIVPIVAYIDGYLAGSSMGQGGFAGWVGITNPGALWTFQAVGWIGGGLSGGVQAALAIPHYIDRVFSRFSGQTAEPHPWTSYHIPVTALTLCSIVFAFPYALPQVTSFYGQPMIDVWQPHSTITPTFNTTYMPPPPVPSFPSVVSATPTPHTVTPYFPPVSFVFNINSSLLPLLIPYVIDNVIECADDFSDTMSRIPYIVADGTSYVWRRWVVPVCQWSFDCFKRHFLKKEPTPRPAPTPPTPSSSRKRDKVSRTLDEVQRMVDSLPGKTLEKIHDYAFGTQDADSPHSHSDSA